MCEATGGVGTDMVRKKSRKQEIHKSTYQQYLPAAFGEFGGGGGGWGARKGGRTWKSISEACLQEQAAYGTRRSKHDNSIVP